jgi:hypothetical protein
VVKDPPTAKLLTMSPRTASIPLCDKEWKKKIPPSVPGNSSYETENTACE